MLTQSVHPEIGRVLARISFDDAQLLVQITEGKPSATSKLYSAAVRAAFQATPLLVAGLVLQPPAPTTFNHAHLRNLGLIARHDGKWQLTPFGEGFMWALTDPSLEGEKEVE